MSKADQIMADFCPDCGANYALVGKMHRCLGKSSVSNLAIKVGNLRVINTIADMKAAVSSNASRQAKWRSSHPEVSRERARDGMRKLRAEKKAQASA